MFRAFSGRAPRRRLGRYGNLQAYEDDPGVFGLRTGRAPGTFNVTQRPIETKVLRVQESVAYWYQWPARRADDAVSLRAVKKERARPRAGTTTA